MKQALFALVAAALAVSNAGAQALEEVGKPVRQEGLPVAPYKAPQAVVKGYQLSSEKLLDEQLAEWAGRSGWIFRWYADATWKVIAPSSYGDDFEKAFLDVMDIVINEEGKPLRFAISRGNRVVEVYPNDLR